jgi:Mor family transcriptional regulator
MTDLPELTGKWKHGRLKVDQVPRHNWEGDVDYYKRVAQFYTLQKGAEHRNACIVSDYEGSISIANIAQRYGISTVSVRNILRKANCSYKIRPPTPEGRNQDIIKSRSDGQSYASIARAYGLTACRIRDICKGEERRLRLERWKLEREAKRNAEREQDHQEG